MNTEENQCDGCRRGLPLEDGIHVSEDGYMIGCTKHLYESFVFPPHESNEEKLPLVCWKEDEIFCGECPACIEWEMTADIEGAEERKRQRIAEENEY